MDFQKGDSVLFTLPGDTKTIAAKVCEVRGGGLYDVMITDAGGLEDIHTNVQLDEKNKMPQEHGKGLLMGEKEPPAELFPGTGAEALPDLHESLTSSVLNIIARRGFDEPAKPIDKQIADAGMFRAASNFAQPIKGNAAIREALAGFYSQFVFDEELVAQAAEMTIEESSFSDPGEDWNEATLKDVNGNVLASKREAGY